ncbi:reverse transcriptase [Senna tora]|uniref:Reverse transcriptase n=1 Tax=Senna tora TaxID=362788 RepID=A0A834T2X5_9FABA|nr:reverse transcriptase [Senna tora]
MNMEKRSVFEEDNVLLMKEVTVEEIRRAAFDLGAMKAPGPDGYSGKFYHVSWSVVGDQETKAVLDFFNNGGSVESINETNIVVIPKVDKPEVQRGFIKGRSINDNIIIAYEVYHYLKNRARGGKFELALKIDMAKAYDKVEWDFLEHVLLKLGFCNGWVRKIMACVSSVNYNVLVGGRNVAEFKPERGLRQGDPLSPCLFILVADVLSSMLNKAVNDGRLCGIKLARGDCVVVAEILKAYCEAFGQDMNLDKSNLFYSKNTPLEIKDDMCILVGRDALQLGIGWKLGNGENIRIWGDKWIPSLKDQAISSVLPNPGWEDRRVSSIIVDGRWNLENILSKEEVNAIKRMYIPIGAQEDERVWVHVNRGVFTVKSGYHVVKQHMAKPVEVRASSSVSVNKELWGAIWKLKVAEKVKHFVWRLCSGSLSVFCNLRQRRCLEDALCPICRKEEESSEHLLLFCGWTELV